jgi:hypothetical protein
MRDSNDRPGPLALDLMQRATLAGLREDADELGAIVREFHRPLPTLPFDGTGREKALRDLLLQARDRAQRLLTLVASDFRS